MSASNLPRVPVMRPQLPTASELHPYIERIDAARYYSNHGPLLIELEAAFAAHFRVAPSQVALINNGTVALSAALVAAGARPGSKCLLPSWTFVGSASAVWAANLVPHFVDVDPDTWMLDLERLKQRPDLHEVGAVMIVSAFGSPVETAACDRFTEETGIPVIIDCAASFDTVATVPAAAPGRSPIMISLHATKVLGTGEGGLVLSTDEALVRRLNQVCNFGVWDSPAGQILGYNGKMSEYNAAVGLAFLKTWPERRAQLAALTDRYQRLLKSKPGIDVLPAFGSGWVSCYCNISPNRGTSDANILALSERGIETRRWWQSGVHVQQAYKAFPRDPLPVTEHLATRVFGVPFFHDLSDNDFERVASGIDAIL